MKPWLTSSIRERDIMTPQVPIKGMAKGFSVQLLVDSKEFLFRIYAPIKVHDRIPGAANLNLLSSTDIVDVEFKTTTRSPVRIDTFYVIMDWKNKSEEEIKEMLLQLSQECLDKMWIEAKRINKMPSVDDLRETIDELFNALPQKGLF